MAREKIRSGEFPTWCGTLRWWLGRIRNIVSGKRGAKIQEKALERLTLTMIVPSPGVELSETEIKKHCQFEEKGKFRRKERIPSRKERVSGAIGAGRCALFVGLDTET